MTRDVFAEALGGADADEQAQFLNVFVRTLGVLCKHTPLGSISMQAHYVAKLLHADTVAFLKDLVETAEHFHTEYSDDKISAKYERIRELEEQIRQKAQALNNA